MQWTKLPGSWIQGKDIYKRHFWGLTRNLNMDYGVDDIEWMLIFLDGLMTMC